MSQVFAVPAARGVPMDTEFFMTLKQYTAPGVIRLTKSLQEWRN